MFKRWFFLELFTEMFFEEPKCFFNGIVAKKTLVAFSEAICSMGGQTEVANVRHCRKSHARRETIPALWLFTWVGCARPHHLFLKTRATAGRPAAARRSEKEEMTDTFGSCMSKYTTAEEWGRPAYKQPTGSKLVLLKDPDFTMYNYITSITIAIFIY